MAKRPTSAQKSGLTRKRPPRAVRESRMERGVLIGTAVVAVAVVGLLIFAVVNENYLKPRRTLANVNGDKITAQDFQYRVKFDYYLQTGGQAPDQLGVDPTYVAQLTLDTMINDRLIAQKAAEMGITVTDDEVQTAAENAFGYYGGGPIPTPTPGPPTPSGPTGTPTVTPTYVYTQTPIPTPTLEPGVTPTATLPPTATLTPTSTPSGPTATPTITPTAAPTPTQEPVTLDQFQTNFDSFLTAVNTVTGVPTDKARQMWYDRLRSTLIRQKLVDKLDLPADSTKVLVHAAHILVDTQDEALQVLQRINNGEDFAVVAAEMSRDDSNAYKGGDLGWFGKGQMVQQFEDAAFALKAGEVSGPVQTQFGWHIIKIYDRQELPTTASEQLQQQQQEFSDMVSQWRTDANLTINDTWQDYVPTLP